MDIFKNAPPVETWEELWTRLSLCSIVCIHHNNSVTVINISVAV